jgi:hypothetical protein
MTKRSIIKRGIDWLSEAGDLPPAAAAYSRAPRKTSPKKPSRPSPNRHSRKCSVCRHPNRADIDQDFLSWQSPDRIAQQYGIPDHSSIYRHAHATGLYEKRAGMIRLALSPLIEQAQTIEATASAVVRAIWVFAHLDDKGKWISHRSNRQKSGLKRHATH